MVKNHLKRIAAPKTWPISRKSNIFVMRPNAGKDMDLSLPIGFVLKEVLCVAETSKQAKSIIKTGNVLINGKKVTDLRQSVGLFETVTLVAENKSFRVGISEQGKMTLVAVSASDAAHKLEKIVGKRLVKGGKMQLNFLSGHVLSTTGKHSYAVGDSVVLDDKNAVKSHLSFKKGMTAQFIGGKHIGSFGTIQSIDEQKIVVTIDGKSVETLKKYAFVVGEDKAAVTIK
ncbi:MAG TPA: hypothetical protein VK158_02765 [Acidobacteriota bacterium]|nr:hypothetical protein [Acidobacteriota bacterium]